MDHGHGPDGALAPFLVVLIAACIVVPLFHRLRLSPVLGYLVAGMLIGPHVAGGLVDPETMAALGHYGVVFLMFAIGLELSVSRLRLMRRTVLGLGSMQVLISAALIGLIAAGIGLDLAGAIVIGFSLALSSTALVLQDLIASNELTARHGRVSFAILLLQDLAVVPLLALIPLLTQAEAGVAAALGGALLQSTAAVIWIVLAARLIVRPVLRMVAARRLPELFMGVTLLVVLGIGWLTERAGVSMALGAFLAGIIVAETEFRHQIEADIEPFRAILLALFFMAVGMAIDLPLVLAHAPLLAALVVALVAIKASVLVALCLFSGHPPDVAVRVGFALAQGGEFGLVAFGVAMAEGVLTPETGQLALAVVTVSVALTPLVGGLGRALARRLAPAHGKAAAVPTHTAERFADHVVIAGFGRVGQSLARLLDARDIPYVALDLEPARVTEGRVRGMPVHYGDASRADVLRAVGVERARAAVITLDHPLAAVRAVRALARHWPTLPILVRARDNRHTDELTEAGATLVVPEMIEGSLQLGGALLQALGLSETEVAAELARVRSAAYRRLTDLIPAHPDHPAELADREA